MTELSDNLETIKDFVEGRLSDKELELKIEGLKATLEDNSVSWTDTYVKTNPFHYLKTLKLTSISGRLNAQGVLELFLKRKGISSTRFKKYSDDYDLILDSQPKYIDADTDFIERVIWPTGQHSKSETKQIMKERFKELFQFHKRQPKWIQSPNWPIKNDKPLYFLGQLEIKDCDLFHDDGSIYIFIDKETGNIESVKQFY